MSNPFFELKKTPIKTANGWDINNRYALQHGSTNHVFSVISNRYKPVTNLEVNTMFDNIMEDMRIKVDRVQNHLDPTGKKWKQWRILKDFDFSIVAKDIVGVMVEIFNGYDGLTGFGFRVLGFRYACTNGMITGKSLLMQHTFKHILKDFSKVEETFQQKFGLFEKNTEIWREWQNVPFSRSEFVELVNNATYMGERLQKRLIEYYPIGITKYGLNETMWGAFNVITDYLTHYTTASKGSSIFSNAVKQLTKLASDFYSFEATPKVPLLTY